MTFFNVQLGICLPGDMYDVVREVAEERHCTHEDVLLQAVAHFCEAVVKERKARERDTAVRRVIDQARLPAPSTVITTTRISGSGSKSVIEVERAGEGRAYLATVDQEGNISHSAFERNLEADCRKDGTVTSAKPSASDGRELRSGRSRAPGHRRYARGTGRSPVRTSELRDNR